MLPDHLAATLIPGFYLMPFVIFGTFVFAVVVLTVGILHAAWSYDEELAEDREVAILESWLDIPWNGGN